MAIIKNAAATIRRRPLNRTMKKIRFSLFLATAASLFLPLGAQATIVDLTTTTSSGTINGVQFQFADHPSGTGLVQAFLRVQANGTEQGYNTSGTPVPFDDKAGTFTHDLTIANLMPTEVTVGGVNYFRLLLGIDQLSASPNISLDQLQIYVGTTGSLTTTNLSSLGTLVYTFSPGDAVYLNAKRSTGNGTGDMFALIPVSLFNSFPTSDFVYLYSHFGNTFATNGGFEEWSLFSPIPEASAFFPIFGLLAAIFSTQFVRRRQLQRVSK